jgi:hydroxypyruvate reductase
MADPLLIALFDAAVRAARGEDLLLANSEVAGNAWRYFGPGESFELQLPQPGRGRVLVTGAGKAAASLARGLEAVLGDRIDSGVVLVKQGHGQTLQRIAVLEGGIPSRTRRGSRARGRSCRPSKERARTTPCSSS